MRRLVVLTIIIALGSVPCHAETTPVPGELLTGTLTGAWYLPLSAPELVGGPVAVWPGELSGADTPGTLVFSAGAWVPEGTKGISWSRGLELIRGESAGDYRFLAGLSRAWGARDLVVPGAGPLRLGLVRTETGLALGWSENGERAGEIRTVNAWVVEAGVPMGNLSLGARAHLLDGSLEDRLFGRSTEGATLLARGRGYAVDLALRAQVAANPAREIAAEAGLMNAAGVMAWQGSITSDGTTRPWSRDERVSPCFAMALEMRRSLNIFRALRVSFESSGGGGDLLTMVDVAPYAAPWRVGLGAQFEATPGLVGTGYLYLSPNGGPSATADVGLRMGRVSTDVALAFDDTLAVASRVMVTGRVAF
ncbi:MAG: hypothetical protein ACM3X3_06975 [Betaproteobacteria bacterium]